MTEPRPGFPQLPGVRRRLLTRAGGLLAIVLIAALVLSGLVGGPAVVPIGLSLGLIVVALLLVGGVALAYSRRSRGFRDTVSRRSGGEPVFISLASTEWASAIARVPEAGRFPRPFAVAVVDDGVELWRDGESERALLVPWGELLSAHPGTATPVAGTGDALPALWLRWMRRDGLLELPITAPRRADVAERLLDAVGAHLPIS